MENDRQIWRTLGDDAELSSRMLVVDRRHLFRGLPLAGVLARFQIKGVKFQIKGVKYRFGKLGKLLCPSSGQYR